MKRIIAITILTFMLSGILAGCVPDSDRENDNNGEIVGGESDESTVGGENIESGGNENEEANGSENTENGDHPTEDGENAESVGKAEENKPEETPLPEVGSEVGKLFKTVSIETIDGGRVSPDDYRGKIVILNIWATWCPPCKAELPDFDKIASDYADDVVIIAAHDYYGRENAPSYVQTNFPDTNIIFAYDSYYGDAYYAAGGDGYVPFTAILDEQGVITYSDSGMLTYEQLKSMIDALIEQ